MALNKGVMHFIFVPQSVTYVQAKNIVDSSHLSGSVAVCDGILRLRVNFVRLYKVYVLRKYVKTQVWIATLSRKHL